MMPAVVSTSLGMVLIDWTSAGICRVVPGVAGPLCPVGPEAPSFVHQAVSDIVDHLAGNVRNLRDIPVDFGDAPPFFKKIWTVLRNNSNPGDIMTYGQLARAAGSPGAARAAGSSMRANPVPVIVPCHRVVGASGPGGYSAPGGLDTKRHLLAIEGVALRLSGRTGVK